MTANEIRRLQAAKHFVQKACNVHQNKYDYSLANYLTCKQPITIICPIHGPFQQKPNAHLSGCGCKLCKFDKLSQITQLRVLKDKSSRTDTFIKRAIECHGPLYDYTQVVYKNAVTPVNIICRHHGQFLQLPINHFSGRGCPTYGLEKLPGGYSDYKFKANPSLKELPAVFYVVKMIENNVPFIKIGITTQSVNNRLSGVKIKGITFTSLYQKTFPLYEAFVLEQQIKHSLQEFRYYPNTKFAGNTECFKFSVYERLIQLATQ